jgi:hypothetical protein
MELDLVLNRARRFLNLKKCVKSRTARFSNGKNWAQTCTWKTFNFLNVVPEVFLKKRNRTKLIQKSMHAICLV